MVTKNSLAFLVAVIIVLFLAFAVRSDPLVLGLLASLLLMSLLYVLAEVYTEAAP